MGISILCIYLFFKPISDDINSTSTFGCKLADSYFNMFESPAARSSKHIETSYSARFV